MYSCPLHFPKVIVPVWLEAMSKGTIPGPFYATKRTLPIKVAVPLQSNADCIKVHARLLSIDKDCLMLQAYTC